MKEECIDELGDNEAPSEPGDPKKDPFNDIVTQLCPNNCNDHGVCNEGGCLHSPHTFIAVMTLCLSWCLRTPEIIQLSSVQKHNIKALNYTSWSKMLKRATFHFGLPTTNLVHALMTYDILQMTCDTPQMICDTSQMTCDTPQMIFEMPQMTCDMSQILVEQCGCIRGISPNSVDDGALNFYLIW